jgi:hypothetical protein
VVLPGQQHLLFGRPKSPQNYTISKEKTNRNGEEGKKGREKVLIHTSYSPFSPCRLKIFQVFGGFLALKSKCCCPGCEPPSLDSLPPGAYPFS